MTKQTSAGLLIFRAKNGQIEVLLVHPGGPWFAKKDLGVWSIPKGLFEAETPLEAAKREFEEEIGSPPPAGGYLELGEVKRRDGKLIEAWAAEGDYDAGNIRSNTFTMEWPPKSGQIVDFPEVDRAGWFDLASASQKLHPEQVPFLERLAAQLNLQFEPPQSAQQASLF